MFERRHVRHAIPYQVQRFVPEIADRQVIEITRAHVAIWIDEEPPGSPRTPQAAPARIVIVDQRPRVSSVLLGLFGKSDDIIDPGCIGDAEVKTVL